MPGHPACAVIVGCGGSARLQPLTRLLGEDDRPKQYCSLFGGETLLAQTRDPVAQTIAPGRTLFAVVKTRECSYEIRVAEVRPSKIFVQPVNKARQPVLIRSLLGFSI